MKIFCVSFFLFVWSNGLAEVYFRFKKIEEIIDIYEETYEKADEN